MTAIDVRPMNETEARAFTERIKATAEHLWALLLEAHERKAWKALGYDCWRDYARVEFGISQSRAYEILDQGKVIRAVEEASGISGIPEISSETARDIKPILPVVTEDIKDRIARGEDPESAVKNSVGAARHAVRAQRGDDRKPARSHLHRPTSDDALEQLRHSLTVLAIVLRPLDVEEVEPDPDWAHELDVLIGQLRKLRNSLKRG